MEWGDRIIYQRINTALHTLLFDRILPHVSQPADPKPTLTKRENYDSDD